MDLDSSPGINTSLYQTVQIDTEGSYLLKIGWMTPMQLPIGKVVGIKANSVFVANVTINDSNYVDHYA